MKEKALSEQQSCMGIGVRLGVRTVKVSSKMANVYWRQLRKICTYESKQRRPLAPPPSRKLLD